MTRLVVDASVVLKGYSPDRERHAEQAERLFDHIASEHVQIVAPELLLLEVVNIAAKKWHFGESSLDVLARSLRDMNVDVQPVDLSRVAAWAGRGLTAYDAAYLAVAEAGSLPFLTDDDHILGVATEVAVPLAEYR